MNPLFTLFFAFTLLIGINLSSAAPPSGPIDPINPIDPIDVNNSHAQSKAPRWFLEKLDNVLNPGATDHSPPYMSSAHILPEIMTCGDARSEIYVWAWDDSGIETVYAEVDGHFIPMIALKSDGKYVGHCSSNLPPGKHTVSVVVADRAGNAVRDKSQTLTILDPRDMNCNGIEDCLEKIEREEVQDNLKVIVVHDEDVSLKQQSLGLWKANFKILSGSSMEVSSDRLEDLARMDGIRGVYEDRKLQILGEYPEGYNPRNDPRMRSESAIGKGVTVAILDTGADPKHLCLDDIDDDLSTEDPKIVAFKDFVNDRKEPYDDHGHGTHCASLIAGTGSGGGVAPGAELVVVKVMDDYGSCYLSDALSALDWCLENREDLEIDAISFSVGGDGPSDGTSLLDEACNNIVDEGVVVCVAAGNSGPNTMSIVEPGAAEKVITVGAVDSDGEIFEMSSRGPTSDDRIKPDLVTVGVEVRSAKAGSFLDQSVMSGTSMATPQVAGAVAVLLEKDPSLKPDEVKRVLLKSADDMGPLEPDNFYGYGALNLTRALEMLEEPEAVKGPVVEDLDLSRPTAKSGDPVMIEAEVSGDVKNVEIHVLGKTREIWIPMSDFDSNSIYTARWETRFWDPGDYTIKVVAKDPFGGEGVAAIPFSLM